jgi:hypothetical protein
MSMDSCGMVMVRGKFHLMGWCMRFPKDQDTVLTGRDASRLTVGSLIPCAFQVSFEVDSDHAAG